MKPPENPASIVASNLNLNLFWKLQSKDVNTRLKASQQLTSTLQTQLNEMVSI